MKVVVSAKFGLLSLNMNYISLLDFNSATYCYEEAPQCFGSGTSDRHLVFFAEPAHAQMALDGLAYQSVTSNVRDSISITIFDGTHGYCLDEATIQPEFARQGCWQVSCQFHVFVGGHADPRKSVLNSGMSAHVWVSVIIGVCVLMSLGCGRCLHRKQQLLR